MLSLRFLLASMVVACSLPTATVALNNGLNLQPQMGWNSWNHFACNLDEDLIKATAQQLVSTGLAAVGYQYVNLDDCWQVDREVDGTIIADPKKFPSGIAALADYVHSLGLKFGLYSDAGTNTCAGRPGSLNYEKIDAHTYAKWNVDYLKYDNCNNLNVDVKLRYPRMRDALNETGRPILFSMCEWGVEDPATWATNVGNSWRTTGDISDNWKSMTSNLDQNDKWWQSAKSGAFNDPDMLEVGNGGMTNDEYQAHFSLWALIKSPLILGNDLTKMTNATLAIITNKEVIALSQDPLSIQGHRVSSPGDLEVWAGGLVNGDLGVILFNRGATTANITATWAQLGLKTGQSATVRDLVAHSALGSFTDSLSLSVPTHGSRTLRLTPGSTSHLPSSTASAAYSSRRHHNMPVQH